MQERCTIWTTRSAAVSVINSFTTTYENELPSTAGSMDLTSRKPDVEQEYAFSSCLRCCPAHDAITVLDTLAFPTVYRARTLDDWFNWPAGAFWMLCSLQVQAVHCHYVIHVRIAVSLTWERRSKNEECVLFIQQAKLKQRMVSCKIIKRGI